MNCSLTKIVDSPGSGASKCRLTTELDQDVVKLSSKLIVKSQLIDRWNRILIKCRSDLICVCALNSQRRIRGTGF